ncbi:MAG TPA: hypothetical protein VFZ53_19205 [Polyangiaceae bacterium]
MPEGPEKNPMDDDSLHALLAGGRLSGPQRDRILERVLDTHARPRAGRRVLFTTLAAALPVAALIALAVRPAPAPRETASADWLVPKGEPGAALVEAHCPGRPTGECRRGDRLIFQIDGAARGGHFAAYADCAGRERIWYFPTETGELPSVPIGAVHFVVPQAARVGDEHGDGRCTLHLFLLEKPAERSSIASGKARALSQVAFPLVVSGEP